MRRSSLTVVEYIPIDDEEFPPGKTIFTVHNKQLAIKKLLNEKQFVFVELAGF